MSNAHGLTKENLLFTFPVSLRGNPSIVALGDVTAEVLTKRPEEISRLSIYPKIDELPEALLDILAHDFKVDWWDPNYSLEEKRRTFKESWYVHRHMGTKAAVETAIRAIYPRSTVEEWFEYGGKPYGFKINLDITGEMWSEDRPRRILERVKFYKSLRSHLDELWYTIRFPPAVLHVGGVVGTSVVFGIAEGKDVFSFRRTIHTGGLYGKSAEIGVPNGPDNVDFQQTVHAAGGTGSIRASLPVPADPSPPSATTILRTGGVCTIISNLSKGE